MAWMEPWLDLGAMPPLHPPPPTHPLSPQFFLKYIIIYVGTNFSNFVL